MEESLGHHYDETIVVTPLPKACSTSKKSEQKPSASQYYNKEDSLGILSLNDLSVASRLNSSRLNKQISVLQNITNVRETTNKLNDALKINREKANATLSKLQMKSAYKSQASTSHQSRTFSESTVSETDFLKTSAVKSRRNASPSQCNKQSFIGDEILRMSDELCQSDMSLREIYDKFKITNSTFMDNVEMDSAMFIPSELIPNQLFEDELSWKRQYRVEAAKSDFSHMSLIGDSKMSLGDFFKGKSDCSSILDKKSPNKYEPMPLIDVSQEYCHSSPEVSDNLIDSSASMSEIYDMVLKNGKTPNDALNMVQNYMKKIESKFVKQPIDEKANLNNRSLTCSKSLENVDSDHGSTTLKYSKQYYSSSNLHSGNSLPHVLSKNENSLECMIDSDKEKCLSKGPCSLQQSMSSIRSTSSMDTLPEGKLPIICTRTQLTWDCVKVGKCSSLSFTIRNRFNRRLRFQVSSTSVSFKMALENDAVTLTTITMYPNESRKFTIHFAPMNIGSHRGKLSFNPILHNEVSKTKCQIIRMYGIGGYAFIELLDILKDSNGKCWLCLGNVGANILLKEFTLRNTGTITGFAQVELVFKTTSSFTNITVAPSKVVLKPGQKCSVVVNYTPSKNDFKHLQSNFKAGSEVIDIAEIKVLSCSEALRGRIRKLNDKLQSAGMAVSEEYLELCKVVETEDIPADINAFKETIDAHCELLGHLDSKFINLTVEHDLEKTVAMGFGETSMFHTLAANQSIINYDESLNKSTTCHLQIEPDLIVLTPPSKCVDNVLLTSDRAKVDKYFIKMQPDDIISVELKKIHTTSRHTEVVLVSCLHNHYSKNHIVNVKIFADQDLIEFTVKIINL